MTTAQQHNYTRARRRVVQAYNVRRIPYDFTYCMLIIMVVTGLLLAVKLYTVVIRTIV